MADFATYLKEAREAAGLNQSELAAMVGLTGSYISVLESRRKPPPSDAVLRRMAEALERPEREVLEVAHLDRTPEDIRKKIRALDRRLSTERKLTHRLLTDLLPSSLWHFWRVRGYHEYGVEKVRLDGRRKRILRKVLRRIGHLTSRDDFEEESRRVIETLPASDRSVLAEALPELVREEPEKGAAAGPVEESAARLVPLYGAPPKGKRSKALDRLPVAGKGPGAMAYFIAAGDGDMLPRIEEGDLLLVDPEAKPSPGDLALVRIGGRVTVRQVLTGKRGHLLVAANPKVAPAEKGDLLGVVSEVRRRL